jgi:hypothetical protein
MEVSRKTVAALMTLGACARLTPHPAARRQGPHPGRLSHSWERSTKLSPAPSKTAEILAEMLDGVTFDATSEGVHWCWIDQIGRYYPATGAGRIL